MRRFVPVVSMLLVLLAAVLGTIGTGMIYKALSVGSIMTLVLGLPLALVGWFWCGRALDQSLHAVLEQRLRRN